MSYAYGFSPNPFQPQPIWGAAPPAANLSPYIPDSRNLAPSSYSPYRNLAELPEDDTAPNTSRRVHFADEPFPFKPARKRTVSMDDYYLSADIIPPTPIATFAPGTPQTAGVNTFGWPSAPPATPIQPSSFGWPSVATSPAPVTAPTPATATFLWSSPMPSSIPMPTPSAPPPNSIGAQGVNAYGWPTAAPSGFNWSPMSPAVVPPSVPWTSPNGLPPIHTSGPAMVPVPIQLFPYLDGNYLHKEFFFDLSASVFQPLFLSAPPVIGRVPIMRKATQSELQTIASSPAITRMRITVDRLPQWPIDVGYGLDPRAWVANQMNVPPLTFGDLLHIIHGHMQTQITHVDWAKLNVSQEEAIGRAFTRRCKAMPPALASIIRSEGVKRVDYLLDKFIFRGLLFVGGDAHTSEWRLITGSSV